MQTKKNRAQSGEMFWRRARQLEILPDLPQWTGTRKSFRNATVSFSAGDSYCPARQAEEAFKQGTPDESLVCQFWNVTEMDHKSAQKFLEKFGPLEMTTDRNQRLDLNDFFCKQLRFKCVTRLWATLDDEQQLKSAWEKLAVHIDRIDSVDDIPLGLPEGAETVVLKAFATEDEKSKRIERWAGVTEPNQLRLNTIELITNEVNRYIEGKTISYSSSATLKRPSFRLTIAPSVSLWEELWRLFTSDTERYVQWRVCPNHDRLFFPPRKDRLFCTSEEQIAESKRTWRKHNRSSTRLAGE